MISARKMPQKDSQYKLIYFNARGLGETIRFIFAYAGVDYEDERIKFDLALGPGHNQQEWLPRKASTPFHQIPVLEVDGKQIGQSKAIARFLARRFNLDGRDEFEQALVDGLADYQTDMIQPLVTMLFESDETRKKEQREKYLNETIHEFLGVFQQHLTKNGAGNGFFVGEEPTWFDFSFSNALQMVQSQETNILDKYPILKAHEQRVNNLKGIKEWIAKRPHTVI